MTYNVLLVDDEPIVKMAFRQLINWHETEYELAGTAASGREALDCIARGQVDIVITDLVMPGMDGIELIQTLKDEGFEGEVLVLSNYSDFDMVRRALVAGATDYMLKVNLNENELLAQLKKAKANILSRRAHMQQSQEEHRRQEHTLQLAVNSAIKDYLLAEGDGPPPEILADYSLQKEIYVVNIVVLPGETPADRAPHAREITNILCSVFAEASIEVVVVREGEYVCFVPAGPLRQKGNKMRDKASNIIRQLKMYLGLPVCVFLPGEASGLAGMRQAYRACLAAHDVLFYPTGPAVFETARLEFAGPPPELEDPTAFDQIVEGYLASEGGQVATHLDELLAACTKNKTHPKEVRNYFYWAAGRILSTSLKEGFAGELADDLAALLNTSTAGELRDKFIDLLPRVLLFTLPNKMHSYKSEVRHVLLYIQLHYMEKITLDDIAGAASLNRSYLCRLFKKETGQSLFQYLNDLRMQKAAAYMHQGDRYVKEIAGKVGIEDQFYFTRLFKAYTGKSPREYCKTLEGGEGEGEPQDQASDPS